MSPTTAVQPEVLPDWLSEDYFRSLLEQKPPGAGVTVKNVHVKFAEEERISGKLIRAAVEVVRPPNDDETRSYIIKRPGPHEFCKTQACLNTFHMEALMLDRVIPAMEKCLESAAPGKFEPLAPRLLDYSTTNENVFLMTEDLTISGFRIGSRQQGLDLKHSLAYAKHIAVFHAASAAILDQYESEITAIPLLINAPDKYFKKVIQISMQGVISELEKSDSGSPHLSEVRNLSRTLPDRLAQANSTRSSTLNVICHGDMYVNNILFREDRGEVTGVRLVDFQLSRVGSFADDLLGFIHSSVNDEVFEAHTDAVVEEYRLALNETLELLGLGARALSQEDVRREMRAQRAVAQFALFYMLPHTRTPGAVDLESTAAFAAPGYLRLLRLLLPRFAAKGWLQESTGASVEGSKAGRGAPVWLTVDYFQSLLRRQKHGAEVTVRSVAVDDVEEEGVHERVFRIDVELETPSGPETRCFRLRRPGSGEFWNVPASTHAMETEALVLGKIVPEVEKILEINSPGNFQPFAPRLVDQGDKSCPFIMTEDVSVLGFKPISHPEGLDLTHSLAFVKILAEFHAASAVVLERGPCEISPIPIFPNSEAWKLFAEFIKKSIKEVITQLQSRTNGSYYAEKVRKLGDTLPERLAENNRRQPSKFKVVCHGSAFINSILFRHQGEEISGVQLTNFQLARVGSFADDVNIFIHGSVADSVLREHTDTLVEEYRKSVNDTLQILKHDLILSAEDVKRELDAQKVVAQLALFHVLPHVRSRGVVNFGSESSLNPPPAFTSPAYRELIQVMLPRFDARGWLDE